MARRLRFNGTDSKNGGCPAIHEDLDSGEVIVQGTPVSDPEDLAQLQHLGPHDAAVAVPRELLVNHGPKERKPVPALIDAEEFGRLFETFAHSAWHLETRRGYASDRNDPGFAEFRRTGRAPMDLDSHWCTNILRQTTGGKYVGRVRVVDDPPTEGQLFLMDYSRCNAATGEDVRSIWRRDAQRAHLPEEDFWIFDSRLAAVLRFDEQDILHGIEVITEPAEVLGYCQVRDTAVHHALPTRAFTAQVHAD
ncbi:hypothetical protein GCM10010277_84850 [Streptomyces longisporoflavus]|uniref:DUF6879 family protein n=1 Tax=Streptomyces longisporoflavus TaxID=28044 RepID=UPI00167D249D|nr:DUF6879 family protein [Streptomyces longisporoflavus]GGV72205.1 hypothetical protein GCM10010277_84850 [Streptomyces longisporoflavus]